MKLRLEIVVAALSLTFLVIGCSSDDESSAAADCEAIAANDPGGQACPDDGCPSVDCVCDDGSSTSISSCFNGVCEGAAACPASCEGSGGWVCESSASNNTAPMMFDCDGESCDSASQFCLISTSGETVVTRACVAIPDGCTECDCLYESARQEFPTSNNCSGVIACFSSGSAQTVECTVPPASPF